MTFSTEFFYIIFFVICYFFDKSSQIDFKFPEKPTTECNQNVAKRSLSYPTIKKS